MMCKRFFQKVAWLFSFAAVLLAGCRSSTPPVKFYTLSSLSSMEKEAPIAEAGHGIAIVVGPVEFPRILDRPQIVTRTSPNRLNVADFHRWAGSLHEDFARVLAEDIAFLLATNQVAVYPWVDHFKPRYGVTVDVKHFEGRLGQDVLLNVIWRVKQQENKKTLLVRESVIKEPLSTTDYEALVAAKSRAIAKLSREIADEIKRLYNTSSPQ